jgi:hypothetical protein
MTEAVHRGVNLLKCTPEALDNLNPLRSERSVEYRLEGIVSLCYGHAT